MQRDKIFDKIRKNKPAAIEHPGSFRDKIEASVEEHYSKLLEQFKAIHIQVTELDGKEELRDYTRNMGELPEAKFAVAENGAVWLDDSNVRNRIDPFKVEKLTVTLQKKNIVADMHKAYQVRDLTDTGFGVFIAGPSKTADIEQSLVYGAHGPKEMEIILY